MSTVTLPSSQEIVGDEITVTPFFPWADGPVGGYSARVEYNNRNLSKSRTIYRFRGIPYSTQPVGDNRFKPATLLAGPVTSPFDATRWGKIPYQNAQESSYISDDPWRPSGGVDNGLLEWAGAYGTEMGEDCLTLNIWTPDTSATLPVVVFFHGGGFTQLAACMFRFHGDWLATKGVVFVTVEYRQAPFGFFYHSSFSAESGIKGNLAFTDQQVALEWINTNISVFGGDPLNVTIMGSSAGAASCLAHMETAEHSYFHKAWVISGGGGGWRYALENDILSADYRSKRLLKWFRRNHFAWSDATKTTDYFYKWLGESTALRKGFHPRHFVPFALHRNSYNQLQKGLTTRQTIKGSNIYPFKDGTFLTYDNAILAFASGTQHNVPLVIGFSSNEASLVSVDEPEVDPTVDIQTVLSKFFNLSTVSLADIYANAYPDYPGTITLQEMERQIYGDVIYGYPSRRIAHEHVAVNANTYWYQWDYVPPGKIYAELPGHGTDVSFWLGTIDWQVGMAANGQAKILTQDLQLMNFMMQRLANFANSGDPNSAYSYAGDFDLFDSPLSATWNAYTQADKNVFLISQVAGAGSDTTYKLSNVNDYRATQYDYFDSILGY